MFALEVFVVCALSPCCCCCGCCGHLTAVRKLSPQRRAASFINDLYASLFSGFWPCCSIIGSPVPVPSLRPMEMMGMERGGHDRRNRLDGSPSIHAGHWRLERRWTLLRLHHHPQPCLDAPSGLRHCDLWIFELLASCRRPFSSTSTCLQSHLKNTLETQSGASHRPQRTIGSYPSGATKSPR